MYVEILLQSAITFWAVLLTEVSQTSMDLLSGCAESTMQKFTKTLTERSAHIFGNSARDTMRNIMEHGNNSSKSSARTVYKLIIPTRLSGLNEYITACRKNPKQGAQLKRIDQGTVERNIRSQLRGLRINKPVRMLYRWFEPNKKRDLDNISSFGRKVVQDALVNCGVLKNDGWKQITGFSDEFYVDKVRPRIEVYIQEV